MNKETEDKNVQLSGSTKNKTTEKNDEKTKEGKISFAKDKHGRVLVVLEQDKSQIVLPIEVMVSFAQATMMKKVSFTVNENDVSLIVNNVAVQLDVPTIQNLGAMCMKVLIRQQQEAMQGKRIITPEDIRKQNPNMGGKKIII